MGIQILAKKHKKIPKTARQLERHFKGVANHRRIKILQLVAINNGITVDGVAVELNGNFKTVSDHIRKLHQAGLVNKTYKGASVTHSLSPYGQTFIKFI